MKVHLIGIAGTGMGSLAGLLKAAGHEAFVRGLAIEGTKTIFDTNTSDHSHFLFEDTGEIADIPLEGMKFAGNVTPPEGYEIVKVDVVIRLRRKSSTNV